MPFLRTVIRAFGVLSPRSRPSMVRTLDYDEPTFLYQVTMSQHLEIKHLKELTAEKISQGVDREYGKVDKFNRWLRDGLQNDNDKLRGWLDAERNKSNHREQAVTKSDQKNVVLRANIRDLKAELDRSEKSRMRDSDLHVEKSKRARDFYTREATHWQRIHNGLKAEMSKEVKHANNRRVYREMNIARAERDKYIGELEDQIATLTQTAKKSDRREESLERQLNELQRKVLVQSCQVTDNAPGVRSLKTELDETKKALDKKNTSQGQLQAANKSLITEKEELENAVSELTADNERDEKTFQKRAAQLAAEMSDQRVKASRDSAVKEAKRLRAEWREDVQRVRTDWQTDVQQVRTEMQTNVQRAHDDWQAWKVDAEAEATSIFKELKTQVQNEMTRANQAEVLVSQLQHTGTELQDALKKANQAVNQAATKSKQAWSAAAEAEATSMIKELKTQVQNETTRANQAEVLVDQLRHAGTELQDALNTANQAVNQAATKSKQAWSAAAEAEATSMIKELKTQVQNETTRANDAVMLVNQLRHAGTELQDALSTANQAVNQAATTSDSAYQMRIRNLVQEVVQQNELLMELQSGDATDQWQDALGNILLTNQTLKKVKSAVDRDGVTYPELQQIAMEATICEQDFSWISPFIIAEKWPRLHGHLYEAYNTMDAVMEAIKGSMPGAVTAEVREKVLEILTTDRANNLPHIPNTDAAMGDAGEEDEEEL